MSKCAMCDGSGKNGGFDCGLCYGTGQVDSRLNTEYRVGYKISCRR